MINYLEAQDIIINKAKSFGTEKIKLDDALGRVLAEDIVADRDYPPFNRSAVDGFAIRLEDFKNGLRVFEVAETIFAGQGNTVEIAVGQCYKIMTGSAVPVIADAVIRREDVLEDSGSVKIQIEVCNQFQNIALRGQDIKSGNKILNMPFKLTASAIGLLASLGKHKVWVEKMPNVAIITTGNEVVPVEEPVSNLQIHNSNLHVLKALLQEKGIKTRNSTHVLDNEADLEEAIKQHLNCDLLIMSGGVSAGDADYVPGVLSKLGVTNLFYKVAIKPGKPIWCGQLPNKGLVFALPGNPFSCLVTFKLFIETYLIACWGTIPKELFKLPINFNRVKRTNFDEFFPVSIIGEKAVLSEVSINGSGDIRLGSFSNALAIHPAEQMEIKTGKEIYYLPLN